MHIFAEEVILSEMDSSPPIYSSTNFVFTPEQHKY